MTTLFPQLAGLVELATDSVKAVAAVLHRSRPAWQEGWIIRDDYTGIYSQRAWSLAPQIWERLSTQAQIPIRNPANGTHAGGATQHREESRSEQTQDYPPQRRFDGPTWDAST